MGAQDTDQPMGCLEEHEAIALLEGTHQGSGTQWRAHLSECERCQEYVAALAQVLLPPSEASVGGWGPGEEGVLSPGTRLGQYVVETMIGRGGMGAVYRGHDDRLDRAVAIKLLHDDAGARGMDLLRREAGTMAQLSHPNVAEVFDIGTSAQGSFVVMEFIDGETLRSWQQGAHTTEAVVSAYVQAGEGLAAAHARGVVHRDFKPSNAMISGAGIVKVLDFGLARVTDAPASGVDAGSFSTLGGFGGTPRYASPEQLDGRGTTPASDQFSFCAALFEALCGELPYRSDSPSHRRTALLEGRIRPVAARVTPHVERALTRGLQADPSKRFGSMSALLRALCTPPRRWAAWGGASAVLLGGVFALWPASDPECADGVGRMQLAWSRPHPEGWTSRPELRAQATKLDAYVEAWLGTRAQLCERREASPAHFDAGVACMERLASRLQATGQTLIGLGPGDTPLPSNLLGELDEPGQCLEERSLASVHDVLRDEYEVFHARALDTESDGHIRPQEQARVKREGLDLLARAEQLGDTRVQGRVAHTLGVMGTISGDYGGSERWYEEAFFAAGLAGDSRAQLDICENQVLLLASYLTEPDRAEFWATKASEIAERHDRDDDRGVAALLHAWVAAAREEEELSLELFNEALRLLGEDRRLRSILDGRAQAYLGLQKWDLARADLNAAIETAEKTLGVSHPLVAGPVNSLATLEIMQDNFGEGARLLERAVTLTPKSDRLRRVSLQGNLGLLQGRLGNYDKALGLFEEIRREFDELLGPENPATLRTELAIVETMTNLGRIDEARREVERLLDRGLPDEFLSRALLAHASVVDDPRPDLERILALPDVAESTRKIAREGLASLDSPP